MVETFTPSTVIQACSILSVKYSGRPPLKPSSRSTAHFRPATVRPRSRGSATRPPPVPGSDGFAAPPRKFGTRGKRRRMPRHPPPPRARAPPGAGAGRGRAPPPPGKGGPFLPSPFPPPPRGGGVGPPLGAAGPPAPGETPRRRRLRRPPRVFRGGGPASAA